MAKILVATEKPFAPAATEGIRAIVENSGDELILLEKYSSKEDLKKAATNTDALIIRSDKIDEEIMDAAPMLKIIVRAGAGYDNVDLKAASSRNIVVENTPGQNSNAVAELVFGLAVMAVRNMFDGTSGSELKDKRLGIHAFGQVGRNVARIAKGFGMRVEAFDPFCPDEIMQEAGVVPVHSIKELYANNDVVSIHIPATPDTVGSIGRDIIVSMPKNAVLINTARKEVIDDAGLMKALEERPDLKYVADVRPSDAAIFEEKFPGRVFFTPKKMGAQTAEANINAGLAAARQTIDFLHNGTARFKVN